MKSTTTRTRMTMSQLDQSLLRTKYADLSPLIRLDTAATIILSKRSGSYSQRSINNVKMNLIDRKSVATRRGHFEIEKKKKKKKKKKKIKTNLPVSFYWFSFCYHGPWRINRELPLIQNTILNQHIRSIWIWQLNCQSLASRRSSHNKTLIEISLKE